MQSWLGKIKRARVGMNLITCGVCIKLIYKAFWDFNGI